MTGYTNAAGNRLQSDGTWNYTYDDEGNMIQRVHIVTGEVWLYAYNHDNRMTKVERKPSAGGAVNLRVEFKHDVLGNRIEKSVDPDGDGVLLAAIQKFAYEGPNAWAD